MQAAKEEEARLPMKTEPTLVMVYGCNVFTMLPL
jgi:hypothetical protein